MSKTPRTDAVYFRSGSTKYDLAGEMKELERENAALRVDKERLDWLAVTDVWFDEPATECYTPETFRAEIDRKRKNNP